LVIARIPAHRHICIHHRRWTRATDDVPIAWLPEAIRAQLRLDRLARRHQDSRLQHALDAAGTITREWAGSDSPIDFRQDWNDRLGRIETHHAGLRIPIEDRLRLAAFPETAMLADLLLSLPRPAAGPEISTWTRPPNSHAAWHGTTSSSAIETLSTSTSARPRDANASDTREQLKSAGPNSGLRPARTCRQGR
jgi:hypothetical protein